MTYLVTGAAGFVGAVVAEKLAKEHEVITIDNLSTGKADHIPEGVEFIQGSVADEAVVNRLLERKIDGILHIAGQSSGEISFEDPVYDLQTNYQSTVLLLNLARKIGCPKFVYASTMSVYGDHNPPECNEQTDLVPKSFYAVGKMASENYMRIFSNQFGIACTALRLFNVYGVGQNLDNLKQGMVSIYLAMAVKDHKICVKGSKDRFRDFVYVDDVADAFIRALGREEGYDVFNVCTGKATTVEQIVSIISETLPYDVSVEYAGGTPGDQFGIYGD
ncbi:MAG: NAD-dependent epimerase/dehydratase family protein, partial [Lachnospiraceae bacterium]|nr:NAD-dependent epimerase/dehydratase family protein [Lachnospiraceae bacterium]